MRNVVGIKKPLFMFLFLISSISFNLPAYSQSEGVSPIVEANTNIVPIAVRGSDDKFHIVYEIFLTPNTKTLTENLNLKQLDIVDKKSNKVIVSYDSKELANLSRSVDKNGGMTKGALLPLDGQLVVLPFVTIAKQSHIPQIILNRFTFEGENHKIFLFEKDVPLDQKKIVAISSPIKGGGWIALNGPGIYSNHRFAILNVDGKYYIGQRYAIDWAQLDDKGSPIRHGADSKKNSSYYSYGNKVYSATDGTVVYVSNNLPDNTPGVVPSSVRTVGDAAGNAIGIDMSNGYFAYYCHLQKNSMQVKVGDKIRRGQFIGLLGNSGNSDGPHLHFHITNSFNKNNPVLGSEGVPYIIDVFSIQLKPDIVEKLGLEDSKPNDKILFNPEKAGDKKKNEIPMANGVYRFE